MSEFVALFSGTNLSHWESRSTRMAKNETFFYISLGESCLLPWVELVRLQSRKGF